MKRRAVAAVAGASKAPRVGSVPLLALASATASPLLALEGNLVEATFVRRPSARNKSPYVGDVRLADGREVIAHMPSMDMGGKLMPGVRVLVRTATDKAGKPVGSDATGKFGTPKCEFIMMLLRCEEPENESTNGCWVGAHPSIGEKVADALVRSGRLDLGGESITHVQREVTAIAGTDMRCDFLVTHADGAKTAMEVKTVVDTDYDPALRARPAGDGDSDDGKSGTNTTPRKGKGKAAKAKEPVCFLGDPERTGGRYSRSGIFPWGRSAQLGPDGEKVVSARAIKHVRELTAIAKGERTEADGAPLHAAVLFVVVRSDAERFRPNAEACPSFARYIREARAAGVRVLAHRISWGDRGEDLGRVFHDGPLECDLDWE